MRTRLGIAITPERISAVAVRSGKLVWAAEASWSDADDLARVLGELAAERPRGARAVAVTLADGVARVKTVEGLPAVPRADLAAHLRLHSRRYFLQNGIPLVTDGMPLAPGHALLAAAPVPVVEAIAEGIEAAGLRCRMLAPLDLLVDAAPLTLDPAHEHAGAAVRTALARGARLTLLPEAARARAADRDWRSLRRWVAIAAGSVMLAATSWAGSRLRQERQARAELTRLDTSLEQALSARRDLDATDRALALIASADAGGLRRARFLAELTRALPDSAFVVSLRLNPDGGGTMSGYAPQAAGVVARLERAGLTRQTALEGAVTREIVGGRELERFALRFRERSTGRAP